MSRLEIKPTLVDRLIAGLSPAQGLRRMVARARFQALAGGYTGARRNRRATSAWNPLGKSADADTLPDLAVLRARSRDAVRNTPIATAAVGRARSLVVGAGLKAHPQIDRDLLGLSAAEADAWERAAAREFAVWGDSKNCDASRAQTFDRLQRLVFQSTLESGDVFAVWVTVERAGWPYSRALRIYEADQVSNPNAVRDGGAALENDKHTLAGGVEIDEDGAPVAYHFLKVHPGNIAGKGSREWRRVEAFGARTGRRQVIHVLDRLRPSQSRGVPMLAPVLESLKQLGTYSDAEMMAAVIGAMIAVVYKTKSGSTLEDAEPTTETGATASDRDYKMASGTVLDIEHDDEVSVPDVGRPNRNFEPFFVAIVREIGAALELPFEVLIQHFTASYSASRAALEMAWQFVRDRRAWLREELCREVYEEVITEAVAAGRLAAPGFFADAIVRRAWLGADWVGPARISVDPLRENKADEIAEDRGWKTAQEITAERTGGDWERKHGQRVKEEGLRGELGVKAPSPAPSPPAAPDAGEAPEDMPEDKPEDETRDET